MARGLDLSKSYLYILDDDKGLPSDEQTKFYVKPKTGHDQNMSTKRYMPSLVDKGNTKELDVAKADAADKQEFTNHVVRIENYAFSDSYYEKHPHLKENEDRVSQVECQDGEVAYFVDVIEDKSLISDVCGDLPGSYLREVLEAIDKRSKLEVIEKG